MGRYFWMVTFLACLFGLGHATAATLTIANVSAADSAADVHVPLNIALDSGDAVCGIQLNLVYDASKMTLTGVHTGQAAANAEKTASFHIATPGKSAIIVSGMNKTSIEAGCVAEAIFDLVSGTANQTCVLSMEKLIMTDAAGRTVASSGVSGSILVAAAEGEVEGQAEGQTEGQAEEGQLEGEAEGQAEGQIEGQAEGQVEGQTEGEQEGQAEGETPGASGGCFSVSTS
jgi:hypothetical protein